LFIHEKQRITREDIHQYALIEAQSNLSNFTNRESAIMNLLKSSIALTCSTAALVAGTGILATTQQASAAAIASVTYNSSISSTATDWSTLDLGGETPYLQLPAFNVANLPAYHQAWATLTGVKITLSSTFTGTYTATRGNSGPLGSVSVSGGPFPGSGTAIPVGANVTAIGPAGTTFTLDLTPATTISSYTIARGETKTVSGITGSDSDFWTTTSPAQLAAFIGTGNLDFSASAGAFVSSVKPSGVSDQVNGFADLRAEVEYTYAVPEPMTMLGVGTALGFGTLFKRKLARKSKKD
jgi:hypothetical protein